MSPKDQFPGDDRNRMAAEFAQRKQEQERAALDSLRGNQPTMDDLQNDSLGTGAPQSTLDDQMRQTLAAQGPMSVSSSTGLIVPQRFADPSGAQPVAPPAQASAPNTVSIADQIPPAMPDAPHSPLPGHDQTDYEQGYDQGYGRGYDLAHELRSETGLHLPGQSEPSIGQPADYISRDQLRAFLESQGAHAQIIDHIVDQMPTDRITPQDLQKLPEMPEHLRHLVPDEQNINKAGNRVIDPDLENRIGHPSHQRRGPRGFYDIYDEDGNLYPGVPESYVNVVEGLEQMAGIDVPKDFSQLAEVHPYMVEILGPAGKLKLEESYAENHADIIGEYAGGFDGDASRSEKKDYIENFVRGAIGKNAGAELPDTSSPLIDGLMRQVVMQGINSVMIDAMQSDPTLRERVQNAPNQEAALEDFLASKEFNNHKWLQFMTSVLSTLPEMHLQHLQTKSWDSIYSAFGSREDGQKALFDYHFENAKGAVKFPMHSFHNIDGIINAYASAQNLQQPMGASSLENNTLYRNAPQQANG